MHERRNPPPVQPFDPPATSTGEATLFSRACAGLDMTHDTPDRTNERRLWCDRCQVSVVPSNDSERPTYLVCGSEF